MQRIPNCQEADKISQPLRSLIKPLVTSTSQLYRVSRLDIQHLYRLLHSVLLFMIGTGA